MTTKLGETIPQSDLLALERRVARLSLLVELATQSADLKQIRDGGNQLIERLWEWLEDIKDLAEVGDDDAHEVLNSFLLRIRLAEKKIKDWQIPEEVVKRAFSAPDEAPKRSRGRPKKRQAA